MTQDLRHIGLVDLDQKHVLTCRKVDGTGPRFTLLWRAKGPKSKPLPKVGALLYLPTGTTVVVERIDPPGTPIEFPRDGKQTLVITPHAPET